MEPNTYEDNSEEIYCRLVKLIYDVSEKHLQFIDGNQYNLSYDNVIVV